MALPVVAAVVVVVVVVVVVLVGLVVVVPVIIPSLSSSQKRRYDGSKVGRWVVGLQCCGQRPDLELQTPKSSSPGVLAAEPCGAEVEPEALLLSPRYSFQHCKRIRSLIQVGG